MEVGQGPNVGCSAKGKKITVISEWGLFQYSQPAMHAGKTSLLPPSSDAVHRRSAVARITSPCHSNNLNREPGIASGHAEYGVCYFLPEHWDHGFESHSEYRVMSMFFCVCVAMCR
jgi:hypothetical protein